jgi:uncharacterized protein YjbJ (UPF0337 family)
LVAKTGWQDGRQQEKLIIRRPRIERRLWNRFKGGNCMKPSTENVIGGKVHEVKGAIKEKVGELTNDPDLEREGIGEKIVGKIQKKIGRVEKAVE